MFNIGTLAKDSVNQHNVTCILRHIARRHNSCIVPIILKIMEVIIWSFYCAMIFLYFVITTQIS